MEFAVDIINNNKIIYAVNDDDIKIIWSEILLRGNCFDLKGYSFRPDLFDLYFDRLLIEKDKKGKIVRTSQIKKVDFPIRKINSSDMLEFRDKPKECFNRNNLKSIWKLIESEFKIDSIHPLSDNRKIINTFDWGKESEKVFLLFYIDDSKFSDNDAHKFRQGSNLKLNKNHKSVSIYERLKEQPKLNRLLETVQENEIINKIYSDKSIQVPNRFYTNIKTSAIV